MAHVTTTEIGDLEHWVRWEVEDRIRTVLHEIRQPVAAVLALAEAARGLPGATTEVVEHLERIIDQVQDVAGAAWSVLAAAADGGVPGGAALDLDALLDSVLASVALTWSGSLRRTGYPGQVWTAGARPAVRRCLVNVLENAVRAAGPDGRVEVCVQCEADEVRVLVDDDGPGFGAVPTGTGLGLLVTEQALRVLGGRLTVGRSPVLGGAQVALCLPLRITDSRCLNASSPTG